MRNVLLLAAFCCMLFLVFSSARAEDKSGELLGQVQQLAKAAENGNAEAQYKLGVLYMNGKILRQDYVKAKFWYEKAAAGGVVNAQYLLGVFYTEGKGVPQNYALAREWFAKAAAAGFVSAQYNLGVLYARGKGVPQNYTEAKKWFLKAAAANHADAQYALGIFYLNGYAVRQNTQFAKDLFAKSCSHGSQKGCAAFKKLSPGQNIPNKPETPNTRDNKRWLETENHLPEKSV